MEQTEYLAHLLGEQPGLLCLGRVDATGRVERKYVAYPARKALTDEDWPYFIPARFYEENGAATTRAIVVDLDNEPADSKFIPGIVVETSRNRINEAYLLTEEISFEEAQTLARKIAPRSDPSDFIRLPGMPNRKYKSAPVVNIVRASLTRHSVSLFRRLPDPNGTAIRELPDYEWQPVGMGPKEFVRTPEVKAAGDKLQSIVETSTSFEEVLIFLNRAALEDPERIYLAKHAASNPYTDQPGWGRETAKALLRVRLRTALADPVVMKIVEMRRKGGRTFERRDQISKYVINLMQQKGIFLHTKGDLGYYVDRQTGRPIYLSVGSEKLKHYITRQLGINPVDAEHRHIREEIISHVDGLPAIADIADIADFDSESNRLLIYLGGNEVLRLSASNVDVSENGADNRVFLMPPTFLALPAEMIDLDSDLSGWWENFFPGMPNVMGMTERQASALLRIWTTFIFFQSAAASRPLLAFVGNFGSGKSTFMTAILKLIYGPEGVPFKITTSGAMDTALSNNLLAMFDNADIAHNWLNDKLATSVARISEGKRKLYTDNDLYLSANRALVGFSSRTAPFVQEDVIDRMLYFPLVRYEDLGIQLKAEADIYSNINRNRHVFMSGLIQDAQKVLRTPMPTEIDIQWRMADFVVLGTWIATALGLEKEFTGALASLKTQQRGFTLELDQGLILALDTYQELCRTKHEWKSAGQLWEDFMTYCGEDITNILKTKYKTAPVMSRKMSAILGLIRRVVPLENMKDDETGFSLWRIKPPEEEKDV